MPTQGIVMSHVAAHVDTPHLAHELQLEDQESPVIQSADLGLVKGKPPELSAVEVDSSVSDRQIIVRVSVHSIPGGCNHGLRPDSDIDARVGDRNVWHSSAAVLSCAIS